MAADNRLVVRSFEVCNYVCILVCTLHFHFIFCKKMKVITNSPVDVLNKKNEIWW